MQTRQHIEEIERVLDGSQTGRDTFVSASWRRCVEVYGMDPLRSDPAHIVTETELKTHRKQAEWMIAAARSGLQSLFRQVAGQNYVLLLTDAEGVCVDFFGDDLFTDELRGAGLYLGSHWSEERAGTCGVGACIVTQEPVTVHQTDHFGNAHTTLSCTAAPIFDSLGKLTAVLDISLLRSPTAKSSQNLAMNLVTNAARRVEMANLMAESRRDWVLRLSSSPEFLDVDPEVAVRLDGAGTVIGYTRGARALFPDNAPILGRRIDEVMGLSVDDLPDLMRNRPTEERIVEMGDGGALFGHAIAPEAPRRANRRTLSNAQDSTRPKGALAGLADGDPSMEQLLLKAEKLAPITVPLLITGETGTGKCRLARAIHMAGQMAGFVTLNSEGLTPDTLRDAIVQAPGPTTLLLCHIEHLAEDTAQTLAAQLDNRSDLRPISTSCTLDPAELPLPANLFHRLCGTTLDMPPLRKRQDLGWLVDRVLRRRSRDDIRLSPSARVNLLGRPWPGNLRELEHVLDVALALSTGSVIDLPDLPAPVEAASHRTETLEEIMEACDWNMSQAARRLGVNRSTILRRIRKAGLQPPN